MNNSAEAIKNFNKVWREKTGTEPPKVTAKFRANNRASIIDYDNPKICYGHTGPDGVWIFEQYWAD